MEVRSLLLRAMDEAFEEAAWHGSNLLGSIRGLSVEAAAWRPAPGRHNIWEIVLHCAYWKHRVCARVVRGLSAGSGPVPAAGVEGRAHAEVAEGAAGAAGAPLGPFPRPGRNWPALRDESSPAAWKADVALLRQTHAALRAVAASLPVSALDRPGAGQKRTRLANLLGIAQHDVYHAGQIRLLRRLAEAAGVVAGGVGRRGRVEAEPER